MYEMLTKEVPAMLFRKKISPDCSYCQFGTKLDNCMFLCSKKGPVSPVEKCICFRYDPFKRIPVKVKALDFSKYDREDYTL